MADPMELELMVQAPGGQPSPTRVIVDPGASPQDTFAKVQAKGLNIVSVGGIKPVPPAPAAPPPSALERFNAIPARAIMALPNSQNILRMAERYPGATTTLGQVGGGTVGGVPGGIIGGNLGYALGHKGQLPSAGEEQGIVAAEALPLVGKAAGNLVVRPAAEAIKGSQMAAKLGRTFGGVMERVYPEQFAGRVIAKAKGILSSLEPMTRKTLQDSLETQGLNITKLDGKGLVELVKTNPEKLANAVMEWEKAGGPRLLTPEDLHRLWINAQIGRATVRAGAAQKIAGLHMDAGGKVLLDGTRIGEAWAALSHEGRAAFGKAGKSIQEFATEMAKLKKASKGIQQLAGTASSPGMLNMGPFLSAYEMIGRAFKNPAQAAIGAGLGVGAGLGAAIEGGPAAMRMIGTHPEIVGAAIAARGVQQLGKKAIHAITEKMLTSERGLQWMAQGTKMLMQGAPAIVVANALFRMGMRSPELLADLGYQGQPQAPQAGQ